MNGRELAAMAGQENVVVIRRPFFEWLGHVSDALLLDQVLYWQSAAGAGQWWHQSDPTLAHRLCLGIKSIAPARERLVAAGYIKTERRGQPFRMFYLADLDLIGKAFAEHLASHPNWDDRKRIASRPKQDDQSSTLGSPSIEGDVKVFDGQSKALKTLGAKAPGTRKPSPWSSLVDQILADYGVAASKGNCSLAGKVVANAQANGLEPEDAAREWAAWMEGVRSEGRLRFVPLHKAANAWASEWLLGERRGSEAIVIEGGIL